VHIEVIGTETYAPIIIVVKMVFAFFCTIRAAGGYGSESEAEDAAESHVTLPQDLPGRGNIKSEKSSVKITEVERVLVELSMSCLS
jgi:hypothetical protein